MSEKNYSTGEKDGVWFRQDGRREEDFRIKHLELWGQAAQSKDKGYLEHVERWSQTKKKEDNQRSLWERMVLEWSQGIGWFNGMVPPKERRRIKPKLAKNG